jgi:ubiquinone/menaquinone biosynthesis C-methylase UbiE
LLRRGKSKFGASYYQDHLAAERLRRCYELASPRVKRYLQAEIEYALSRIAPTDTVLELGSGYGRVLDDLAKHARVTVGIDTSRASLHMAKTTIPAAQLFQMDATALAFADNVFNKVICIQNGISAFHVDQKALIAEALRVSKLGGTALFSSYAESFWPERLEWFYAQAAAGLIGEIDPAKTRDDVIVCKDGFTATTVNEAQFRSLTRDLECDLRCAIVDGSSLFCEIKKR